MSKMINCKTCDAEIAVSAKVCPKCGAKNKKPIYKRVWVWFLMAIILIAVISSTGGDSNVDTNTVNPSANVSTDVDNASTNTPSEEIKTPATEPVEKLTIGQKNAIRKAESYIDVMPFSAKGLIKQLEFDGFSSEDASFAVNNIDVDWNEQAALKAESYLDLMAFSADGLADQLEYEGFTEEQISYALKAVGY